MLVTLVVLYHKFSDPTLDPGICEAAHKSLEKHWKKADQDVFLLVVILNPYLWVSCFLERSPYQNFSNVLHLAWRVFLQLYGMEPNLEFHSTLQEYVSEIGGWSAVDMGLNQHAEQAKHEVCMPLTCHTHSANQAFTFNIESKCESHPSLVEYG